MEFKVAYKHVREFLQTVLLKEEISSCQVRKCGSQVTPVASIEVTGFSDLEPKKLKSIKNHLHLTLRNKNA